MHSALALAARVAQAVALAIVFASPAAAALERGEPREFLPVDEAFAMGADVVDGRLRIFWQIAPDYYLYRHRFSFEAAGDGFALADDAVRLPPGEPKQDEYFGDVEVYHGQVAATLPLSEALAEGARIAVRYQGCAEKGLCYPPETRYVALKPDTGRAAVMNSAGAAGDVAGAGGEASAALATGAPSAAGAEAGYRSEERQLAGVLEGGGLLVALAVFFTAGVGLAFTPCVLPMVPIISSIVAGEAVGGALSRRRAFSLSLAYVLGMALTYAALGTVIGYFGGAVNIHGWLQHPAVLTAFALLFAALALAMFGVFDLRLPAFVRTRLDAASGRRLARRANGRHAGVVAMGAFSSLVVSPCVSAPLAGALIYLSATGDALLGGLALMALGLGMGVPLLVVGVGGGALLPRTGRWMNAVRGVFGLGLLGVAVWLLARVVPGPVALALWSALAIGASVVMGGLDFSRRDHVGARLLQAGGALAFVYGVLLLVGAASGASDPLRPLALRTAGEAHAAEQVGALAFARVEGLPGLQRELAAAADRGRPVMVDLYADWCVACKVMEHQVFPAPAVRPALERFHRVRVDVTENTRGDRALLERYGLFGPPSLLFFGTDGAELETLRLQGEPDAPELRAHLDAVLARSGV